MSVFNIVKQVELLEYWSELIRDLDSRGSIIEVDCEGDVAMWGDREAELTPPSISLMAPRTNVRIQYRQASRALDGTARSADRLLGRPTWRHHLRNPLRLWIPLHLYEEPSKISMAA
jgi:hypothetical protein